MNESLESLSAALKLRLLRELDAGRAWDSLNEKLHCVLCERNITGHEIRVETNRRGGTRLRCPTRGCQAGPGHWVHPGNPLISEEAWHDWARLLAVGA